MLFIYLMSVTCTISISIISKGQEMGITSLPSEVLLKLDKGGNKIEKGGMKPLNLNYFVSLFSLQVCFSTRSSKSD